MDHLIETWMLSSIYLYPNAVSCSFALLLLLPRKKRAAAAAASCHGAMSGFVRIFLGIIGAGAVPVFCCVCAVPVMRGDRQSNISVHRIAYICTYGKYVV
ncbi:hypothetical protein B0T19DRAFT_174522 [Cercophora scortea]|uniref:Uncharacterized protein n=1 Tax=Cercophora scortea TaxID=314031 RepID=A0AAE0IMT9_9PEZI|nr:hypothetical protein B0T19DRAFT_174522 [Cercophora scortea]